MMKRVLLLAALLGASLADSCPAQCKCSVISSGGTMAHCSTLDAAEQQFGDNIQHLEVSNIPPQDGWLNTLEDRLFVDLRLSHLESIKITNTSLKSIDINAFRGLPNLYDLVLSDNKIEKIDPDTFEFSNYLHRLILAGNPLKPDVSKYFLKSESLTELDISRCNLSKITPEMFSKLDNLIFLNLGSNNLKDIGHFWKYKDFEFIEELDLSDNQIQKIDTKILSEHSELASLNLRKNLLESFDYVDIPELEELDLSQNKFQAINANTFKNLPEVIHVNLSHNEIHFIAEDSFIHAPNLKHLSLAYNKIKGPLPVYMLQKNKDIENLKLAGNKNLKVFTGEEGLSGEHANLYTLDISDCGLEVIKSNSFQRMENIASLNLSGNALHTLDADVFSKLRRLNNLDLSNNHIMNLNTSLFSSNSELRKLVVSGNPLVNSFNPHLFLHLHHLRYLDASHCQLTEMWSFRDAAFLTSHKILANLEFLNLSNNNIKHLHINDFTSAHALTTLDIRNNPLTCTKHFTELIQWFISQEIDPERLKNELLKQMSDFDNSDKVVEKSIEWKEVIEQVCPSSADLSKSVKKFQRVLGSEIKKVVEDESKYEKVKTTTTTTTTTESSKVPSTDSTLTLFIPGVDLDDIFPAGDKSQETYSEEVFAESNLYNWMFWTFIVFGIVLLLAIINLTGVLCFRAAPARPSYIGPVGGYVRTKNDGGSLYYKLYEECSVPNTPIVKNKTVVLDFNQFLKKPTYNIVKDIDTLPSQV